jgi:hypothetical protein
MNMTRNTFSVPRAPARFFATKAPHFLAAIALAMLLSTPAVAQYGGGGMGTGTTGTPGSPGYTSPGYGSGKAIGIGVGAAAAGGIALYVALHHHSSVTGCVESADDGLRLADEKNKKTFSLVAGGIDLKPGERVELSGKKSRVADGGQAFQAKKLVKTLGSCGS